MSEATRILLEIEQGDLSGTDQLFAHVYNELRRLAATHLAREAPGHTLQPTALVHEAFMKLVQGVRVAGEEQATPSDPADESQAAGAISWRSKGHFFAATAQAMRRILIDLAREKQTLKRGGDRQRVDIEPSLFATSESEDLLALDQALSELECQHPEKAEVVKLRYFAGLTIEETAAALNVSTPTVKRHWNYARAWLRREMTESSDDG